MLVAASAACNALTGVDDLSAGPGDVCPECDGGAARPDGGGGPTDGAVSADGAPLDAGTDAGPQPWGGLDPTFGVAGTALLQLPLREVRAALVLPDGKIVVVGASTGNDAALLRVLPDGQPDPAFGAGGLVVDGFGNSSELRAVALDATGRVVVAGVTVVVDANGTHRYGFASRYSATGQRDTGFGIQGRSRTLTDNQEWSALVLDPSGSIFTAGQCDTNGRDFGVFKLTQSGGGELGFGTAGRVCHSFGNGIDAALAMAPSPNGTLVLAGYARVTNDDGAAVRVTRATGDGDPTFGTLGRSTFAVGTQTDRAVAAAVGADGKVVLAVEVAIEPSAGQDRDRDDFGVARLTASGALDPTFGTAGVVTTDFPQLANDEDRGDHPTAILLQADGRVMVAGFSDLRTNGVGRVVRYTPTGALDPLFADSGVLTLSLPNGDLRARALATTPDGKVVVASETDGAGVVLTRFVP